MDINITFKSTDATDSDVLIELMREFYQVEHLRFDEQVAQGALQKILSDASLGRVWLMQHEKTAIGYVVLTFGFSLEFKGRDAFVDELYVRADYRGRGAGTTTLKFVEDACPALGVQAIHLEVDRTNTKAQALYRKFGFSDHDRYLMTKSIPTQHT